MNWNRWFYKWHKWFAVVAGLLTLIWFVSGVVITLPRSWLGGEQTGAGSARQAPGFEQAAVTVPEAIAVVEKTAEAPVRVSGISLRRLHGRLLYSISTNRGSHWVDALSGEIFVITEAVAREIIAEELGTNLAPRSVSLIKKYELDYTWGPLPAYRFDFDDSAGTIAFVIAQDGEVRSSTRLRRIRTFIGGTHTLEFLNPYLPKWSVKLTMLIFSILGLVMTVLGGAILWIQLRQWWRSPGRAA